MSQKILNNANLEIYKELSTNTYRRNSEWQTTTLLLPGKMVIELITMEPAKWKNYTTHLTRKSITNRKELCGQKISRLYFNEGKAVSLLAWKLSYGITNSLLKRNSNTNPQGIPSIPYYAIGGQKISSNISFHPNSYKNYSQAKQRADHNLSQNLNSAPVTWQTLIDSKQSSVRGATSPPKSICKYKFTH